MSSTANVTWRVPVALGTALLMALSALPARADATPARANATPARASATPANVETQALAVNVNMARIVRLNAPAATVVVGNPGIADVTIQDPQTLVLTGKSFGQTNLIILDKVGNPIADTLVNVVAQNAGLVTVYQGDARTTVMCDPDCQPTITLGDDPNYTSTNISSSKMIEGAAK